MGGISVRFRTFPLFPCQRYGGGDGGISARLRRVAEAGPGGRRIQGATSLVLVRSGISPLFCFCRGYGLKKRTTKRYDGKSMQYVIRWEGKIGKKNIGRKRILGGLKAYLRATDHTSSNIISRDMWASIVFWLNLFIVLNFIVMFILWFYVRGNYLYSLL
jgi:hypothetical protein